MQRFFSLLENIYFWPVSVGIYFLLIISWGNFFILFFPIRPPPRPPLPITFLVLLPIPNHTQLRFSALSRTPSGYDRWSNVKLNDTAVWKKLAFEKLWKCHFTIGIKSMILLIVLTAACWKSSGLRQQYSITVVRLAGHQTTTRP